MKTAVQKLTLEEKIIAKVKETMADLVTDEELNEYASSAIKEAITNTINNYSNNYNNPIKDTAKNIVNKLVNEIEADEDLHKLIIELFVKNLPYLLMEMMRDGFRRTLEIDSYHTEMRIMERLNKPRF